MRAQHFPVLVSCLASTLALAACSTDSEPLPGGGGGNLVTSGGAGGTSAAAGKSGAGTAGTGATAGAGTAGTSSTGGAGATAGSAGAGTGGVAGGGAGGAAGGTGGTGGATGGTGGTAGGAGGATGGKGGATGGSAGATGGSAGSAGGTGGAGGNPLMGTPDDKAAVLAALANPCTDDLATVYDDPTPLAMWDASKRGTIVKCAYDRLVPVAEMQAHFSTFMLPDPGIYTDVHKLRVTYWTERDSDVPLIGAGGAAGSTPKGVITSAVFYVPALRASTNAKASPLLVYGHPTVGAADVCAPSKDDNTNGANQDWRSKVYGLVGHGWPLIMPDMPGLGTSGTPAWQDSEDAGHSLLDATRAVRKIAKPTLIGAKNAFLGHSEGGHAVLAAQSYAATYGGDGTFDGFVAFAPVSFSQASWEAILTPVGASLGYFKPGPFAFASLYIYGHLAKYEGESHRTDMVLPGVQAGYETAMSTQCLYTATASDVLGNALFALDPVMKPAAADFFPDTYTKEVGNCAAFGSPCTGMTAAWWRDRWVADRPQPDKTLPIVIWQGLMDASVSPPLQQCGVDRLTAQGGQVSVCADAAADHSGIVTSVIASTWVDQYLNAQLLGGAAPAACPKFEKLDPMTMMSAPYKCATPPPNSVMPTDPLERRLALAIQNARAALAYALYVVEAGGHDGFQGGA